MTDMAELVESMTLEQRKGALVAMDAFSRPLTMREIEAALRRKGLSRSRAVLVAEAVKRLAIVALIGPEVQENVK